MSGIEIRGLRKVFGGRAGVVAVDGVDLTVSPGEMLVLLGPSGCGKTTILRCVAGLEEPNEGEVSLDSRLVFSSPRGVQLPPEKRKLGMVFQAYAVWPHKTVFENVAYPLEEQAVRRPELSERVTEMLGVVGLADHGRRYPHELSGGQQQRVALARALVTRPRAVLFDEPLSNLDARLRDQMRFEIVELQSRFGFTGLYVTHDQGEAMAVGHRVAVLNAGRVIQMGPPREVYDRCNSAFVADFLGATNLLPAALLPDSLERGVLKAGALGTVRVSELPSLVQDSDALRVGVRSEHVRLALSAAELPAENTWAGMIAVGVYAGDSSLYTVDVEGVRIRVKADASLELTRGQVAFVHFPPSRVVAYSA
jgi:iron(III) transport system ATP-binding protein